MIKRIIQAVVMPTFVITIQLFFRFLFDVEVIGIGVSLASVALAQIFPYLFFDNLIILKIFKLTSETGDIEDNLVTKYSFKVNKKATEILGLKNLTIMLFVLILALFIITLGLSLKPGYYNYHFIFGIMAIVLSVGYLILA